VTLVATGWSSPSLVISQVLQVVINADTNYGIRTVWIFSRAVAGYKIVVIVWIPNLSSDVMESQDLRRKVWHYVQLIHAAESGSNQTIKVTVEGIISNTRLSESPK